MTINKQCVFINDKGEAATVFIPVSELPSLEQIRNGLDPLPFCNNLLKIKDKKTSKIYQLLSTTKGGMSKIKVPSVQWMKMPFHKEKFPDIIMIASRPKSWTLNHLVKIAVRKEKVDQSESKIGGKLHPERTLSTINHRATFINKRHTIFGTGLIYDPHSDFTLERFKKLYQSSFRFNEQTLAIAILIVYFSAKNDVENFKEICDTYLHIDSISSQQITSFENFISMIKNNFDKRLINISKLNQYRQKIENYLRSNTRVTQRSLVQYIEKLIVPESELNNIEMKSDEKPQNEDDRRKLLNEFIEKVVKDYMITFEDLFIMLQPMINEIYVKNNRNYFNAFVADPVKEREMLFVNFNQGSKSNIAPYTWDKPPKPIIGENERIEIKKIMEEQCKYVGEIYIDPFL